MLYAFFDSQALRKRKRQAVILCNWCVVDLQPHQIAYHTFLWKYRAAWKNMITLFLFLFKSASHFQPDTTGSNIYCYAVISM